MSVNEIHFSASFAITYNLLPFKAILLNHTPADLPQMGSELGCMYSRRSNVRSVLQLGCGLVGTPVCRLCGRYLVILGRPIRFTVPAVTVAPTALVGSLIRSSNLPHSLQRGVCTYNHWQRSSANLPYMGMGPGKIEQKR